MNHSLFFFSISSGINRDSNHYYTIQMWFFFFSLHSVGMFDFTKSTWKYWLISENRDRAWNWFQVRIIIIIDLTIMLRFDGNFMSKHFLGQRSVLKELRLNKQQHNCNFKNSNVSLEQKIYEKCLVLILLPMKSHWNLMYLPDLLMKIKYLMVNWECLTLENLWAKWKKCHLILVSIFTCALAYLVYSAYSALNSLSLSIL